MSSATPIPLEVFDTQLKTKYVGMYPCSALVCSAAPYSCATSIVKWLTRMLEVTVSTLGGRVLSTSDDFFASKDNLIKPYVSIPVAF